MKRLIWKIRFAREARKLLCIPWAVCWEMAGSWMEMLNGDTSEDPLDCVQEEIEEWRQCCD